MVGANTDISLDKPMPPPPGLERLSPETLELGGGYTPYLAGINAGMYLHRFYF